MATPSPTRNQVSLLPLLDTVLDAVEVVVAAGRIGTPQSRAAALGADAARGRELVEASALDERLRPRSVACGASRG